MKTVLLIEDNRDIRENLAEILELSNYKVLTAADGKEGVTMALNNHPDLIVCDIMMPVLDGYGVIHMLQKNEQTKNTPFIFLTAKAERADLRKGMELGADDYITKPFSGAELLNAVERRLKKTEALKQELAPGLIGLSALINTTASTDAIKGLMEFNTPDIYRKKQTVYSEGNKPRSLFFIKKGKVKTYRTNEEGKELITAIYQEGDFLGYMALLEESAYKDSAKTIEDAEITEVPKDTFTELLNNNRDVMYRFIRLLAGNISEREQQLMAIAYNSLRKKVADALVSIQRKYKRDNEKANIDISRENLANIVGIAKESLIRTLSDFKDERLIDIVSGDIVIINEKALEQMLN